MSYRDDNDARADRADALIREIADLERQRVARAAEDERLAEARNQLAALQAAPGPTPPPVERGPGLTLHALVFAATAAVAFVGYRLLV